MDVHSSPYPTFFLAKRRGVSEIIATLMIFVITLAISAIPISLLLQRASTSSSIALQESERAKLEQLTAVKILGSQKAGNGTCVLLYNPSDVTVNVEVVFVKGRPHSVNAVLRPFEIIEVLLNPGVQEDDLNDVYLLTSEGFLIHAKA
ncbi:MAG: hypothetical protein HA491_02480 [Candidatus Verstraetearchaeota archaeon]|nr:hypothetical protein [Candidatus Verstraetearchaeota archaeon]